MGPAQTLWSELEPLVSWQEIELEEQLSAGWEMPVALALLLWFRCCKQVKRKSRLSRLHL